MPPRTFCGSAVRAVIGRRCRPMRNSAGHPAVTTEARPGISRRSGKERVGAPWPTQHRTRWSASAPLPVLVEGTGLNASGQPSLDGGSPVPHLPADLQTRRPGAFPFPATQRRQRHLEQPRGIPLGQQALVIAHGSGRQGAPRSAVPHPWPGHWTSNANPNLADVELFGPEPPPCEQGSSHRDGVHPWMTWGVASGCTGVVACGWMWRLPGGGSVRS
jgi:hypothetical protein